MSDSTPAAGSGASISDGELVITRVFDAPRDLVWKAWTEVERLARWWGPAMTEAGEFGERMNGMPKHVVSGTLRQLDWNNSTLLEGDVAKSVAQPKQQYERDVLVAGSATLVQALTRHNLVDEYTLLVYPIVLGSGKRLFADVDKVPLRLLESRPVGSGA